MMCFDLGGPVNKAAYVFAIAGLAARPPTARFQIMAAVMAAGMVPPLALALATTVAAEAVHRARAGERPGRLAAGCLVHLRGRDPVRGGRPAAGHPVDDGRWRGDRCAVSWPSAVDLRAPHGGIFVLFAIDTSSAS